LFQLIQELFLCIGYCVTNLIKSQNEGFCTALNLWRRFYHFGVQYGELSPNKVCEDIPRGILWHL
jgi:hypothetical protein